MGYLYEGQWLEGGNRDWPESRFLKGENSGQIAFCQGFSVESRLWATRLWHCGLPSALFCRGLLAKSRPSDLEVV